MSHLDRIPRWAVALSLCATLVAALLGSGPSGADAQDATETPTTTEETTDDSVTADEAEFAVGDSLLVIDGPLNVRESAGTDAEVLYQLLTGAGVEITDGPVSSDGYTWYEIVDADGDTGWVAGEFLGTEVAATFAVGDEIAVVDGPVNVREDSGLDGDVLTQLATGDTSTIVDGPVSVDGFTWYQVEFGETTGWVAAEFFGLAGDVDEPSDGEFAAGDEVIVVDGPVNVRNDNSLDGDVITQLATGDTVTIIDGPVSADGYTWYQVEFGDTSGWVAGEFFGLAGDVNEPGALDFGVGDAVRAGVDGMNFRAAAGLDADVLDTVDLDALFVVRDGPVVADGYTWFQVFNYYYGEGWVAGELMVLEPDGFPAEEDA